MRYTGQQWDESAQMYYLRARYYNPLNNGRFNRVDPYSGNTQDPQSLHKYLYCHANPINATDPNGFLSTIDIAIIVISIILLVMTVTGLHPAAHHGIPAIKEERRWTEGTEAITIMHPGLQEQVNREAVAAADPEVLKFNMEFWHEHAEMDKAVTLYNLKTEQTLLEAIDTSYHGLEAAEIGLGVAGAFASCPIFWSKPHPPSNPAHWKTIADNSIRRSARGNAKAIYTHRSLTTITGGTINSDLKPDISVILPNNHYNLYEVLSPNQTHKDLLKKGWRYKQLLGEKLEYYDIINIGGQIP